MQSYLIPEPMCLTSMLYRLFVNQLTWGLPERPAGSSPLAVTSSCSLGQAEFAQGCAGGTGLLQLSVGLNDAAQVLAPSLFQPR